MKIIKWLLVACLPIVVACEKPYVGEDVEPEASVPPNVIIRVNGFEQIPFDTRASVNITEVCSRINFVVYEGETKVKSIAQKAGDSDYGTLAVALPEGEYTFAIVAHNTDGTATVTSLDKISFKNNVIYDTFSYCEDLQVGDTPIVKDIELRRVVAKFRLELLDEQLPAEVTQFKFYYTGGSSTLSALTGYGSVNSRQTVKMEVARNQHEFEVYTFPKTETGALKMTITALDAAENSIKEMVLENVPVQRNMITVYTGTFFDGQSAQSNQASFTMTADTAWTETSHYTF